jgi:uncharacterized protein (TIGR02391 family)
MNLKSLIRRELWLAISNTYEAENYSHAVLDAMHYLSEVIREKSGVDGDGHGLVGAAFGGQSPILRVNKLQTETERNIQKGLEQILRGMYQGIRNPRSHEQVEDTKNTADSIIYFVNYLLSIIDQSQEPFTVAGFVSKVFDKHFVKSSRYAELLVSEIPQGKYLDILVEIYRRKREGEGDSIGYVVKEILKLITEEQTSEFLVIVSEELKTTQDNTDLRVTLQMLPPVLWKSLNMMARMRAENILIKSIADGRANSQGNTLNGEGTLATWADEFLQYFELKYQAGDTILKKIEGNFEEQMYIFAFFLRKLPSIYDGSYLKESCISAICKAVKEEGFDCDLEKRLTSTYWSLPEDWRNSIISELPNLKVDDEIPF